MAKITVHAGDFRKGRGDYGFGMLTLYKTDQPWKTDTFSAKEIVEIDVASEDNVKRIGGTVGWGAAGAVLLGPAGLLAGLLLGGRKKEVTFVAQLKDGRKMLATTDSKTYTKLLAAAFDNRS